MPHRCGICGHYGCIASDFEDAHTRMGIRPNRHPIFDVNKIVDQNGREVYINLQYDGDKFVWPHMSGGFVEWHVIDSNSYRIVNGAP